MKFSITSNEYELNEVSAENQQNTLNRMKRAKQNQEKYGKVDVSFTKDENNNQIVTIKGNFFSKGMTDAIAAFREDICHCGCYSCMDGLHQECQSDGQSCYHIGSHRVNDGVYKGEVVKKPRGF